MANFHPVFKKYVIVKNFLILIITLKYVVVEITSTQCVLSEERLINVGTKIALLIAQSIFHQI
jgi:hypothetical protein